MIRTRSRHQRNHPARRLNDSDCSGGLPEYRPSLCMQVLQQIFAYFEPSFLFDTYGRKNRFTQYLHYWIYLHSWLNVTTLLTLYTFIWITLLRLWCVLLDDFFYNIIMTLCLFFDIVFKNLSFTFSLSMQNTWKSWVSTFFLSSISSEQEIRWKCHLRLKSKNRRKYVLT